MGVAGIGEITVDLIDDDVHIVAAADRAVLGELFPRPHAARRILGRAEDAQGDIVLHDLPLDVVEVVHAVFLAPADEGALDEAASVIADDRFEPVIDRRLDQDGVIRLREGPHGHIEGRYDARRLDEPFFFHVPPEMGEEPLMDRPEIIVCHIGIAHDAVIEASAERVRHARRGLEVHVGDPERDGVPRSSFRVGEVVLQGHGVFPVDDRIEIKHDSPPFAPLPRGRSVIRGIGNFCPALFRTKNKSAVPAPPHQHRKMILYLYSLS